MRLLKTDDPCPCCGLPIKLTDPDALRLLTDFATLLGLPDRRPPAEANARENNYIAMLKRHDLEYH